MTALPRPAPELDRGPDRRDPLRLGMAQLCAFGLSEPWLLKDCGDRHWALIAEAAGQPGPGLHDAEGRAIYAAFAATRLELAPPGCGTAPAGAALLGAEIDIGARLCAVGPGRLGTEQVIRQDGRTLGRVTMISCLLGHDETRSNRRLLRRSLTLRQVPAPATPALADLDGRARATARRLRSAVPGADPVAVLRPVPALDFNAVGLLYFPTFAMLAERARPATAPLARRDVVYTGNLDPGETVALEDRDGGLLLSSGGRVLGHVATRHHLEPSG